MISDGDGEKSRPTSTTGAVGSSSDKVDNRAARVEFEGEALDTIGYLADLSRQQSRESEKTESRDRFATWLAKRVVERTSRGVERVSVVELPSQQSDEVAAEVV